MPTGISVEALHNSSCCQKKSRVCVDVCWRGNDGHPEQTLAPQEGCLTHAGCLGLLNHPVTTQVTTPHTLSLGPYSPSCPPCISPEHPYSSWGMPCSFKKKERKTKTKAEQNKQNKSQLNSIIWRYSITWLFCR